MSTAGGHVYTMSKVIQFRVTDDLYTDLEAKAKGLNLGVNEWARQTCIQNTTTPVYSETCIQPETTDCIQEPKPKAKPVKAKKAPINPSAAKALESAARAAAVPIIDQASRMQSKGSLWARHQGRSVLD